jgi:hypothetical protein
LEITADWNTFISATPARKRVKLLQNGSLFARRSRPLRPARLPPW